MAVVHRGAGQQDASAYLEDGSSFCIPPEVVRSLGLEEGSVIPDETLLHHCTHHRAAVKALTLLARREHSCRELRRKLRERSFPEEIIDQVIDSLLKSSYLDDRRFAQEWVRQRLERRPEGTRKLAAALAAKGVDRQIVQEVLAEVDEYEAAQRACEKLMRKPSMTRDRCIRSLANKGFSRKVIDSCVDAEDDYTGGF